MKYSPRMCRCQAAPEGGAGKSLFNFRAWCANLGSNLLLGQEQKQRRDEQPSKDTPQGESAVSESATAEQPTELCILPATTAEEESWELWKEVRNIHHKSHKFHPKGLGEPFT
jgi:hypothetical protein